MTNKAKWPLAGLAVLLAVMLAPPAVVLWKLDRVDRSIQEQASPATISSIVPGGGGTITTPQGMAESDEDWLARHARKLSMASEGRDG